MDIKLRKLRSGENVDAIFVDGKYLDETKEISLHPSDIKYHQCSIKICTNDEKNIKIDFHSFEELADFIKAYEIK